MGRTKLHAGERIGPWGAAVTALREAQGLNMGELAVRAGVSKNTVTNVERGLGTRTKELWQIADGLGVPIESVLVPLSLLRTSADLHKDSMHPQTSVAGVAHASGQGRDVPTVASLVDK